MLHELYQPDAENQISQEEPNEGPEGPAGSTESDGDAASPPPPPPSGGSNMMPLIIGGVIARVVVIITLLIVFNPFATTPEEQRDEDRRQRAEQVTYFELPDIVVNLYDPAGRHGGLLKLSVYLELENKEDEQHVERLKPKILDQFQLHLRGLKTKDISGSTGLQRLREELLNLASGITDPIVVRSVLFREMLVQ